MKSVKSINYKIYFSEIADKDIEQAVEYYSNISESSVYNFKYQLNQVLDNLELNPFYQVRYKNVRAIPFKSLPFITLFSINEKEKIVYIYSFFNTYQDTLKYPNS
jgi:hypothetical protein